MTDLSRRRLLNGALAASAACVASPTIASAADAPARATKGRIKQSLVSWCYMSAGDKWSIDRLCEVAKELGCPSIELVGPEHWDTLKKHGLTCAIASSGVKGGFVRGLNNLDIQEEVVSTTAATMEKCAGFKVPSVIAFTGMKWRVPEDPKSGEISLENGADNCVAGLKKLAALGEKHKVTVCFEHLNSRDGSHPMKGHPGYQGDNLDYVADIVKRVGSPRVKILFDIYHVQIMNGDVIRRLDQYQDLIGHIHTAGCPGRGELDENQEINYPPIMRKLIDIGYQGYVGQEFIPTRDALAGLRQAVTLCDV
jgi:sugar phosphate isomerase/epimerase